MSGNVSSTPKKKVFAITFADDIKEAEVAMADVVIVESYKEHNYDNTH
jgi:ribosomal protein L1